MEAVTIQKTKGLNAYQIKLIALVIMTIDHLGAYGFEIPIIGAYYSKLRLIGRLAMPLFLFVLTESIRYTHSKPKFLLRLYLGAVGTGLFVSVTNYLFGDTVGRFSLNNIFYTYFYVALYVILIENILLAAKDRDWKKGVLSVAGIAATGIVHCLYTLLMDILFMNYGLTLNQTMFVVDLIETFIESPWIVEYTLLFVLMGVLMYFARSKHGKAAVLVLFSFLCYAGGRADWNSGIGRFLNSTPLFTVMGFPQCCMALAAPIMLLYNGEKGRGQKYFFYLYYPLHRYAISVAEYIYWLLCGI